MKKLISCVLALTLCLGLCAAALASTAPEDLFEPQVWFGDWPDAYELGDWDFYDEDVNGTGLLLHFVTEPEVGLRLGQAYADRLSEDGDLLERSRKTYESEYGEYDLEVCYSYIGPGEVGAVTSLLGAERCSLAVDAVWLDEDHVCVALAWGEGFPMDVDDIDIMTADSAPASGSGSVSYAADSTYLPDPDAWFDYEAVRGEDMDAYGGHLVSYSLDLNDLPAIEDYVALLAEDSRFQLELVDTYINDYTSTSARKFYNLLFDYTGSAPVEPITVIGVEDYVADVVVGYSEDYANGTCGMTVYYANDFTFVDDGDRCGFAVADRIGGGSGGSSGSSGGGSGIDRGTGSGGRKCTVCGGDGKRDCMTCGGKGYIEEYVSVPNYSGSTYGSGSGWERHDCPNAFCRDGEVECWTCGGDGWID